jgi:adenylate cyclase
MKRCPDCRRDYYDDTLLYCLDDGSALLEGPGVTSGEATAVLRVPYHDAFDAQSETRLFADIRSQAETVNSIAVLPFANISADPENEYFCDGLAEELLNALTKIESLKVAARTSAFSFKNKNVSVSEIGEKLGVKTILDGSVRKSGNRIRILVQLVNASDGFHLWSQRYDREFKDIFDLQDEITLAVTDALKVTLLAKERDVVLRRYTDNTEAYELFLRGRHHHYQYTAEGWVRAIEFFGKAIEKEPLYSPAYAAMTSSWGYLWFFGLVSSEVAIPAMNVATAKALEIDNDLAAAHVSSAMVRFFHDWEWSKAENEFRIALLLNANNPEAFSFYSMFLAFEERFEEAVVQCKRSIAIDPLSPLINMNAGWTYFTAGMIEQALDQVTRMTEIEPDFYGAYWLKGAISLMQGNFGEAIEELTKGVSLGGHQTVLADLGSAYGLAGRREEAEAVLNQLLETREQTYVSAICMARVYSRLGDNDHAVEWLEKAFVERNGEMLFLKGEIETAAEKDPLRQLADDARVTEIFRRMNLPN